MEKERPTDFLPEGSGENARAREDGGNDLAEKTPGKAPRRPRDTAKADARFYAFAALFFALLLFAAPIVRAVRETSADPAETPMQSAVMETDAPEATPKPTQQPASSPGPTAEEGGTENSPAPVYMQTAILVNGKTAGVLASREAAEELLHDVKAHYEAMVEGEGRLTSSFIDEVEFMDAPEATELTTHEALYETFVNGRHPLKVQTVLQQETADEISFKEETLRDDALLKGLRVVKSLGHNGQSSVVNRVIYTNGEEKKTETDEKTVVFESVNRVVIVGTLSPKDGEPGRSEGKKGKDAGELSFTAPAEEKPSSNFGRRNGGMHFGLDYTLDEGASILAAEAGKVVSVLVRGNYGLTVEIDHGNGFLTRYAHLGSALVSLNDTVTKGQQIAAAGTETYGEEGNFHFELRIDGFACNPRYYLP
ncbi:MAG TPA: peptidoglycan DD-metalloendopeptidase family protein [Clostridia bacterium]|nr:peptidoglycan DD-metalloendopeptidase family protein [Clostridia bacterium]